MPEPTYDFAIIGAGAAGLQLALALTDDPWFTEKQVVIIDRDLKKTNDKTWCFWENGPGKWDEIVYRSWSAARFISGTSDLDLQLSPYSYKMLRSIDFYGYAKEKIRQSENITWMHDEVIETEGSDPVLINCPTAHLEAFHVFDSRIDPGYSPDDPGYIHLLQHFKGWHIQTDLKQFDERSFVMMDYRPKWKNTTSFMYVLPLSKHEALVEFTFFSPELVDESVYDSVIRSYISDFLKIEGYRIISNETGIIPMTNYPFHKSGNSSITKIGTAGSWVKGSSGYSFHNAGKKVARIIDNIKQDKPPAMGLIKSRFRFYDRLFLDVLYRHNEKGESIFSDMYSRNSIGDIFRFLDEESGLGTDLKIISSLKPGPFLAAAGRHFFRLG